MISGPVYQTIYALESKNANIKRDFERLVLSPAVSTVIGCRMTPKEKQLFVTLIKNAPKKKIVLAVGDGANDVSMINEAHVGIGIQGVEGREAAKASDFAIA